MANTSVFGAPTVLSLKASFSQPIAVCNNLTDWEVNKKSVVSKIVESKLKCRLL